VLLVLLVFIVFIELIELLVLTMLESQEARKPEGLKARRSEGHVFTTETQSTRSKEKCLKSEGSL